jgi:formylglycine-generating enzyme required for sulfatase activity
VEQAVDGIAEQNRVVPVRLALFAEMFRHRPWTVEGLISVGGAEGVGRVFLEETFRSDRAPPQYRQHSQGAQQVLTALLPDVGSDIRGHRRSQGELIEAAGYTGRPREGAELLQILDQDLRLISPIEAPSAQAVPAASGPEASSSTSSPPETDRQYHLTHDYLVPSLRRWVEDILGSTPAGRAKLLLRERSRLWNDRPLDRNLPTWGEHLRIRRRTDPAQRTDVERRMLARAAVVHGRNVSFMMVVLTGLALGSWWFSHRLEQQRFAQEVSAAVDQLATAQPATWARVLERLREPRARSLASERLARIMANVAAESRAPTVAERIAQLTIADDRTQLEPLRDVLLTGPIQEFLPTREQLRPYGTTLAETLWNILRDEEIVAPQRARAAMALAAFAPAPDAVTPASDEVPTQDWGVEDIKFICRQMVACTPDELPVLTEAMRPVSRLMIDQLEQVFAENFRQRKKLASHMRISVLQNAINLNQELDRRVSRAAQVVAKYPEVVPPAQMVRLIALSTPAEFATLFSAWETQLRNNCENILARIASEVPADQMLSEPRIAFARQRASTAVALLRLGRWQQALKVCDMADDPEAMTRFMLECRSRGASIQTLLRCLDEVSQHDIKLFDPRVRYALLIALGTFPISDVPAAERRQRTQQVTEWYRNDPSSSVHGAAGWLLRQWGATENAIEVEQTAVPYEAGREWYTQVIDLQPKSKPANTTGQSETPPPLTKIAMTFIIFPAGEYAIGLPNHTSGEAMRRVVTLSRPFALMDREVTVGEMAAFQPDHFADSDGNLRGRKGHPSVAVGSVKWYDAVEYCRWLGFQCQLGEQQQCYAAHDSDELQGYDRDVDTEFYLDPYNRFPRLWPLKLGQAGYRLPTEAEWEVASRGLSLANGLGTVGRTLYGFGSEPELLEYFGWFRDNSGERQHEVRSRVPSLRGLWDMHGGQSEWVHDMHPGPWRAAREIDPTGNNSGMDNFHVQRGGSYSRSAMDCSSTYLHWDSAKRSTSDAGFRVAVFPSH